jgi:hypothetical protein
VGSSITGYNPNIFASLNRDWEDFTSNHKEVREKAEEVIDTYANLLAEQAKEVPLLIIAGGFGSGKTQLLYHVFKYSWKDKKIPALYVNLKSLLRAVNQNVNPSGAQGVTANQVAKVISELALTKLRFIRDKFNEGYDLNSFWLPTVTGSLANLPPAELFKKGGIDPDEALKLIDKALERKGVVLLIDEVEEAYEEFLGLLGREFRDFVEAIGTGSWGIYTVMAVSYLSYYELFLAKFTPDTAFARRVRLIQLPPVDPDTLYNILGANDEKRKSNTFWWFTRGRLGWVTHLKDVIMLPDEKADLSGWIKAPQLQTPVVENLPVLDVYELLRYETKLCHDNDSCRAALRYFLLNIRPHETESLPGFVKGEVDNLIDGIVQCNELTGLEEVVGSFVKDIEDFYEEVGVNINTRDVEFMERAIREVLSAFASREGAEKKLCVGAPDAYTLTDSVKKYVEAILDILMTYIAENYPSNVEQGRATELLYTVYSQALSDDKWKDHKTFYRVKTLFGNHIGTKYSIIGPWLLRSFIPMYLSNPIISVGQNLTKDSLEQKISSFLKDQGVDTVAGVVGAVSQSIVGSKQDETVIPYIIPVPKTQLNEHIEEKIIAIIDSLVQKHLNDMKYSKKKIVFFFAGGDDKLVDDLKKGLGKRPLLSGFLLSDFLVNRRKRVIMSPIPGERLSDFVKSVFILLAEGSPRGTKTIEGILEELRPDQRRRAEYFKTTLGAWLSDSLDEVKKPDRGLGTGVDQKTRELVQNDLKMIGEMLKRVPKFASPTKAYAALFALISDEFRKPFEEMDYTLSPGGLLRISSLPSIYQEFHKSHKEVRLESVPELLNNSLISSIGEVALEDVNKAGLEDALGILNNDPLPFYDDFEDVLRKTFGVSGGEKEEFSLLYRLFLLTKLLVMRKDDVLRRLPGVDRIMDLAKKLLDLLGEVDSVSSALCRDTPLCVQVTIGPENRAKSLKDEVEGVLKALTEIKQYANGQELSPHEKIFWPVAFITTFGLSGNNGRHKDQLLDQLDEELKEWYDKINDKIYKRLSEIQQKISQLSPLFQKGGVVNVPGPISREPINIRVNTFKDLKDDVETAGLGEILTEIGQILEKYRSTTNMIEEDKREIKRALEYMKDGINKLGGEWGSA